MGGDHLDGSGMIGRPRRPAARRPRAGSIVAVALALAVLGAVAPIASAGPPRPSRTGPIPATACATTYGWQTENLTLGLGSQQATFEGQYGAEYIPGDTNLSDLGYNFSYTLRNLAEITPSGDVDRVASLLAPFAGSVCSENSTTGPVLVGTYSTNVTSGSGPWAPVVSNFGAPTSANASSTPPNGTWGTTTVRFVWHLGPPPSTSASTPYRLKFDLDVGGWPWQNRSDHLGALFTGLAAWGAHFEFVRSGNLSNALLQVPNGTTATNGSGWQLGLQLGSNASSSTNGTLGPPLNVSEDVGLYAGGTAYDREADLAVNFTGAGGYSNLSYDPWLLFDPLGLHPPTSSSAGGGALAFLSGLGGTGLAVLLLAVSAVVALAAIGAIAARRRPAEDGLARR